MKKAYLLIAFSTIFLTNCTSHTSSDTSSDTEYNSTAGSSELSESRADYNEAASASSYSSGSDNVEYYNPNTGTQSNYTLDIDYDSNGDVERITFNNGGWLDDTHIVDQTHNGDGTITVTTDKGYEYTVDESSEYESDATEESSDLSEDSDE